MPIGDKTDQEADETCFGLLCCYLCMCVNTCFRVVFEEVIDHAADGNQTAKEYFDQQEKSHAISATCFRILGFFLAVLGLNLIFAPVILLLKWIPFIGFLLGGIA